MKSPISHGISIGIERVDSEFFLYFKAIGHLSHADYELITPLIEQALQSVAHPQVKAFVDATDFQGWELRAAWDDFTLGLKHGNEFSRVAILGNSKWQKVASRIASWFISGEVQFFEDRDAALEWLIQPCEPTEKEDAGQAGSSGAENPIFPAHS